MTTHEIALEADVIRQQMVAAGEDRSAHRILSWKALVVAASLLMAVTGYFLLHRHRSVAHEGAYAQFRQQIGEKSLEYKNDGDSAQRIVLPDGSEVRLEKNSQLSYAVNTTLGKREAYLRGAAFFSIARNPSQTFIVYTQDLVTQVLGTSFSIDAPDNGKNGKCFR